MLRIVNLNEKVIKENGIRRTDITPIASIPDKNQVLYRVATSSEGGTNYVIIGDENGPPDKACLMFSLEGLLEINPELKIQRLN